MKQEGYKSKNGIKKVVDTIFRSGNKHGNHGDIAVNMVSSLVKQIRDEYNHDVAIIIRIGRFLDEEMADAFDELGIGVIGSGKIYEKTKGYVEGLSDGEWIRSGNSLSITGTG